MKKIRIVEVGLRDGLQNDPRSFTSEQKIKLAKDLILAGVTHLELGAFVRGDKVPQMADSDQVVRAVLKEQSGKKLSFSALVPNQKGMEEAIRSGLGEVAVFASCTESFSKKNINCSIDESFARFDPVLVSAKKNRMRVRGYLSVCFGCPYEGEVSEKQVIRLIRRMFDRGIYEVSVGDTIGIAHERQVISLIKKIKSEFGLKNIAGHFHNTRGQALINISAAYKLGVKVFDSSVGGLGGCPYAPGASGNVATEEVVYFFEKSGVSTGINVERIRELGLSVK